VFLFFHLSDISTGNDCLKIIDIQTELTYIVSARRQCLIKHSKMFSKLTLQAKFAKCFHKETSAQAKREKGT